MKLLFVSALLAQLILGMSIPISIYTQLKIWPPPSRWSWQYFFKWGMVAFLVIVYTYIGVTHYSGIGLHTYIGIAITITGVSLLVKCINSLTLSTASGVKGELVTSGIYSWSRNPMYIADMLIIIGTASIFHFYYTWIIALLWCIGFLFTPLAEEPWLIKEYGNTYLDYMKNTPRFIPRLKFDRRQNES